MFCEIHPNKEMKQNKRGWYCSTPIKRSEDGTQVLEWCQYKPAKVASPERQQLEGKVLTLLDNKMDKIITMLEQITGDLANRP